MILNCCCSHITSDKVTYFSYVHRMLHSRSQYTSYFKIKTICRISIALQNNCNINITESNNTWFIR